MKYENGKITFASGNVLDMCGTDSFSLSVRDGDGGLSNGYDGSVWSPETETGDAYDMGDLSIADRAEIADHMIARWQQWKAECAT